MIIKFFILASNFLAVNKNLCRILANIFHLLKPQYLFENNCNSNIFLFRKKFTFWKIFWVFIYQKRQNEHFVIQITVLQGFLSFRLKRFSVVYSFYNNINWVWIVHYCNCYSFLRHHSSFWLKIIKKNYTVQILV